MIHIANANRLLPHNHWMKWILSVEYGQQVLFSTIQLKMLIFEKINSLMTLCASQTALYNDLEKLEKFIASGQTNNVDATGYTALHYSARSGHLTACEKLLNAGADVDACTRSGGVTSLIRAALMGNFQYTDHVLLAKFSTNLNYHYLCFRS